MTTADHTTLVTAAPADTHALTTVPARTKLAALEHWLEKGGDRLNPILVKETRQALKSKQFTLTFMLLLLCGWAWTFIGAAMVGPGIFYGAHGRELFYGYFVALAFPLCVVVPYGAFRSLAAEREDGTYEMLSITSLAPWQIISGKLGSAIVQMIIYFSAISPCLAFTYMLRGIDVPTIFFALYYVFLASAGLSAVTLLIATLTQEKFWQVLLTVAVVAGTFFVFWVVIFAMFEFINETIDFYERYFWIGNAVFLTFYLSYFVLVFLAATSQLTFTSCNRSTALRVAMTIQFMLFTGWMAWFWFFEAPGQWEFVFLYLLLGGLHWYVMGAFLTGESSLLSPRVRRRLPRSTLGRMLLSWYAPGSGTGFMFVVGNFLTLLVLSSLALVVASLLRIDLQATAFAGMTTDVLVQFAILGTSYAIIYLGIGRFVMMFARRHLTISPLAPLLIQILILAMACGIPFAVHGMSPARFGTDYSLLHTTNALWTMTEAMAGRSSPEIRWLLLILPATALAMVAAHLPSIAKEVRLGRLVAPPRVRQEEAELAGKDLAPPEPVRTNPWGDVKQVVSEENL
jgi:hypothetical protein